MGHNRQWTAFMNFYISRLKSSFLLIYGSKIEKGDEERKGGREEKRN